MRVTVTLEYRFHKTTDGAFWTNTTFAYPFWERYLDVFDEINVVARAREAAEPAATWKRADGEGVRFSSLTNYVGARQYALKAISVTRELRSSFKRDDAVILRLGSHIAVLLQKRLLASGHPFGVEVVSDPFDFFSPGAFEHPLRPFFRSYFSRHLRNLCSNACAAAYVTKSFLQSRYPQRPGSFAIDFSDVELSGAEYGTRPRVFRETRSPRTLILVGGLNQLYKGTHVLLDALHYLDREGVDLRLVIVGGGQYRPRLEAQADSQGLAGRVTFRGELPSGSRVMDELDKADLFVLPSFSEGLPRAMLEAMARGLPCIGSNVGGIPDLLVSEDTVRPGDAGALAGLIRAVVTDPARMTRMAARNLAKAGEYRDDNLRQRRVEFYRYVRTRTEEWLSNVQVRRSRFAIPRPFPGNPS